MLGKVVRIPIVYFVLLLLIVPFVLLGNPTFYDGVWPILEKRCLACHSTGGAAPMSFETYEQARPWAAAIRESVKLGKMPPWFADPAHGEFANDPRLSEEEIAIIDNWSRAGAHRGARKRTYRRADVHPEADVSIRMPQPFPVPAGAIIEYQYVVMPLPFAEERWIKAVRVSPGDPAVVHHAVVYIREPASQWLRDAKPGVPFAASGDALVRSRDTTADILAIYTPGMNDVTYPEGMAKKIPAGSHLVLQLHYTSGKKDTTDQTQIALMFYDGRPKKQILTLQMGRDDLLIPPGEARYRASVSGTLPQDALLISLFPHMHLRGSAFEFEVVGTGGYMETLLRVKPFHFSWQLNYILKEPRLLRKGTRLRWTGYFDNSANNPWNPDPSAEVPWGEQSTDEMMIGFFDVAVDPDMSKADFFVR